MKQKIIEVLNALYDLKNFLKYSFKIKNLDNQFHYTAYLTKQYHTVEKGLALPTPRLGFGEKKINDLLNLTPRYIEKFGEDSLTKNIISVLNEYLKFHADRDFKSELISKIEKFVKKKKSSEETGGVRDFNGPNISRQEYDKFIKSRASVRNFKDKQVTKQTILEAIETAKYTPSVCNRQGWKVHIYQGNDALRMLNLQNGSGGFRENVKTVAIVTGDINYFSSNERNQVGIDSGMFCMSLILSFYSLGVASCALNTCVSLRSENRIKQNGKIPKHEKVIMYLALGYAQDNCTVAKSQRRANDSFVTFH